MTEHANTFPILPRFNPKNPPTITYAINLDRVNILLEEKRYTISGREHTLILLVPPRGCRYDCDFCSIKHIAFPAFPLTTEAAENAVKQICILLEVRSEIEVHTLKLFNAGNILYGTAEGEVRGEMHEHFWEVLPDVLVYWGVSCLELEVRVDEFVSIGAREAQKEIIRQRILQLQADLVKHHIELRLILPFEYLESGIIAAQRKFPVAFTRGQDAARRNAEVAVTFMRTYKIPWLGYAMLGGRLPDRPLTAEEAITSAVHTTLFALEQGAREVIINSQYIDPINQWEELRDGIRYFVPSPADMRETVRLLLPHLDRTRRIRLTPDKEDVIKGTIGPERHADFTPEFREHIYGFNNAPNQQDYFQTYLA